MTHCIYIYSLRLHPRPTAVYVYRKPDILQCYICLIFLCNIAHYTYLYLSLENRHNLIKMYSLQRTIYHGKKKNIYFPDLILNKLSLGPHDENIKQYSRIIMFFYLIIKKINCKVVGTFNA